MPTLSSESEKSIIKSGIVKRHAHIINKIALDKNTFILFRPVNGGLIEYGYSTKDLHVKPKSSDWGPQSGFICADSNLCKKYGNAQGISDNDKYIQITIKNNEAFPVPLLLSVERIEQLIRLGKIKCTNGPQDCYSKPNNRYIGKRKSEDTGIEESMEDYIFTFVPLKINLLRKNKFENFHMPVGYEKYKDQFDSLLTEKNKALLEIQYEKIESEHYTRYIILYQKIGDPKKIEYHLFEPITVFAKTSEEVKPDDVKSPIRARYFKADDEGTFLPMTADYDLFLIAPNIKNYREYYNEFLSEETHSDTSFDDGSSLEILSDPYLSSEDDEWDRVRTDASSKISSDANMSSTDSFGLSKANRAKTKFKAAVKTIIASTGAKERKEIHKHLGKMSEFSIYIKDLINLEIKEICHHEGGNTVHHGAEVDNFNGANIDFPMTVFTPFNRVLSISNKLDLQICLSEIKLLGYAVYVNILWKDENYSEAVEEMRKRLLKKTGITQTNKYLFGKTFTDFDLNYSKNRRNRDPEKCLLFFQEEFEKLEKNEQKNIIRILDELEKTEI